MTDWSASRQLGTTAQKWRVLAESRRAYFSDLYRSGRWQLYFQEDEFLERMREVVAACERWEQIAPKAVTVAVPAPPQAGHQATRGAQRNAA